MERGLRLLVVLAAAVVVVLVVAGPEPRRVSEDAGVAVSRQPASAEPVQEPHRNAEDRRRAQRKRRETWRLAIALAALEAVAPDPSRGTFPDQIGPSPTGPYYPMSGDQMLGGFGNVTIYERPDGSHYGLDREGRGAELPSSQGPSGPAEFDSRPLASGDWAGSNSYP